MPTSHGRRLLSTLRFFLPVLLFALVIPLRGCGPKVPAGFHAELIYAAPEIEHPSVVTCDDEGNLFVGEDPMDMRGPAREPIDRVLLIRWDKHGGPPKKTVFCEGLSAVFGLVWHKGALYVMHAPHYSMFVDTDGDGVADVRKDLAHGFGPPAGKYEFNDHIVSGMRLGMDGFMYISVGDKGIPRATGSDGSSISLEGGGIVRMRPDGTQLELFSSGTRNHLDVAMDALDNLFTYDNTDDGLGWWTRFTHHIPTGYYGYPYDYRDHADRHLPRISEHGPGAPAGAACYLEAAWPEKYRGSAFHCEWGKRRIQQFSLRPNGASFGCTMSDFMTRGHKDEYRPLDLCFSPDGRHMYVADWNFAGWVKPNIAGRLYRVTYIGHDVAPEPPRAVDSDPVEAQIRSLAHPAYSERMRAQWALAARGEQAIAAVAGVLRSAPDRLARIHAIWTQNALIERVAGYDPSADWIGALGDKDADVRAQAARALGTRRFKSSAVALAEALHDSSATVRLHAAVGLGRLGDSDRAESLVGALADDDIHVRFAVIQSLRAIRNWESLSAAIQSNELKLRRAGLLAATGVYDDGAVALLSHAVKSLPEADERTMALLALAEVHRQSAPYDGGWWGGRPAGGKPARIRTNEWSGTALVLETLRDALLPEHPPAVQRAAVQAFRDVPDPAALAPLRRLAANSAVTDLRCETIATLAALDDRESIALFSTMACDASNAEILRREALQAIVALRPVEAAPQLVEMAADENCPESLLSLTLEALAGIGSKESGLVVERRLADCRPAIRARAAVAWAAVAGKGAVPQLTRLLRADRDASVRLAAIGALGRLHATDAVPFLIEAAQSPALKFDAQQALAAIPDPRALKLYLEGLTGPNVDLRSACRSALKAIHDRIDDDILSLHRQKKLPENVCRALQPVFGEAGSPRDPRFAFLFENVPAVPDPSTYADFAQKNKGNAARGRTMFADRQGVGCIKCHAVHGEGGRIGPDLAGVGTLNRREELAKAVLDPSDRIAQSYEQTSIITTRGKTLTGMIKSETPETLEMQDTEGTVTRVPVAEIDERVKSRISIMPSGLHEGISLQDFADIVAYLENLKEPPRGVTR